MNKINCYIINYNRLTTLKGMVNYLSKESRINIIVVDNNSTYKPLLDYYESNEFKDKGTVLKMNNNYGYKVCWEQNIVPKNERYIITDSDLMLDNISSDWLDRMNYYLNVTEAQKVGFSLDIKNIPNSNPLKNNIISHEQSFWQNKFDGNSFIAPIDTTFALYKEGNLNHFLFPAIRLGEPYTAIHFPWNQIELTEEDEYYFNHISNKIGDSHWSRQIKKIK